MKMHFEEGLSARFKAGDSTKLVTKGIRGKSASEKLTEEGLVKFSARVTIQVVSCELIKYKDLFLLCSEKYINRLQFFLSLSILSYRG